EIKASLQKISGISAQYNEFHERISSLLIEFDDINNEVGQDAEKLADDPQQLELVNQKLQLIYMLQKKHQVATVEELIAIREELDGKVVMADELDSTIEKLEAQLEKAKAEADATALTIFENRQKAIPVL